QKKTGRDEQDRQELARKLYKTCDEAAFAEGSQLGRLLATEPLMNLGKQYSRELPNALVIGAKGAGKTFTFRQLVKSKNWQCFLSELGFAKPDITEAAIFPLLWSTNLSDKPDGEIKSAQRH